jgi:hypothetical protein
LTALVHFIFGFSQGETDELQGGSFVEIPDGKDALENCLQADLLPILGRNILLQKVLVGRSLDID